MLIVFVLNFAQFNKDVGAKEHVFERMAQLRTEIYESNVKSYPLVCITHDT